MRPEVIFVRLQRPEKALLLCRLAEYYYRQGQRCLVLVEDSNQGTALDRFMWTFRSSSFVPHAWDSGAVDCLEEPVVISCLRHNPNAATVLLLGTPAPVNFLRRFQVVLDLAEQHDSRLVYRSRQRWKAYLKCGWQPHLQNISSFQSATP